MNWADRIEPAADSEDGASIPAPLPEPPRLLVSLVTGEDDEAPAFIESLAQQSYPLQRIDLRVVHVGAAGELLPRLSRLKEELGDRFARFDLRHFPRMSLAAAHKFNTADLSADYILVSSPAVRLDRVALAHAVDAAFAADERTAVWEFASLCNRPDDQDNASVNVKGAAPCALIAARALDYVGGFRETTHGDGVLVELWYRLRDSGYRLITCSSAQFDMAAVETGATGLPPTYEAAASDLFMRLRYGTLGRRLAVPLQCWRLLRYSRRQVLDHMPPAELVARIAKTTPRYLARRRRSSRAFPICGWSHDFLKPLVTSTVGAAYGRSWPLVSVVVRTEKGRQGFLVECLRSLANQSHAAVEVVVVEAGQTGFARDVVPWGIFGGRRHVRCIESPFNRPSRIGNAGLEAARGDYLAVIDDDNLLFADHLTRLVAALEADPEAAGAYARCLEIETEIVSSDPLFYYEGRRRRLARRRFGFGEMMKNDLLPVTSVLFRRRSYEKCGGFDTKLAAAEAWDLWLRMAAQAPLVHVPHVTAVCRAPLDPSARRRREEILKANRKAVRDKYDGDGPTIPEPRAEASS